ncbi:MAG: WD40 repeat domain-containing protein [Symplocastrum torsivum CPER-KK1]|jgi:WD40 repeat protein|uniref:WD40 repeat domain-containing protein n=1 Tax=Symplocastrum torsivum CPER-KK1 TaxID=450513 RepID=A0A951UCS1_9CYAN|nr:WD40 repeat domain-containing protein [Symplocastrum torsivum CPER-KK1]
MQRTVAKLIPFALLLLSFLTATTLHSLHHPDFAALATTPQLTSTAKSWENAQLVQTLRPLGAPTPEPCTGFSITSEAFSPDSQMLAVGVHSYVQSVCGGGSSNLSLWNLQTGKQIKTLVQGGAGEALLAIEEHRNQEPDDPNALVGDIAHQVAFTPDGKIVAAAMSDKTIKLWNGKTGELLRTLTGHNYAVHAIAISSDGQTLISGSSDKTIKLWNLKTGQLIRTLRDSQPVYQLLLSSDGESLASVTSRNSLSYGLGDTIVTLWNLKTGKVVRSLSDFADASASPLLSPDGQILVTGSNDNSIKLWNARTGVRIRSLMSHSATVTRLAITPDGQFLASSSSNDGTVKLWNFKTGQIIRTIPDLKFINSLAFSSDGRTLAMHDGSRGLQVWNWRLPKKIRTIEVNSNFSFTPDGQSLIAGHNYAIEVWR